MGSQTIPRGPAFLLVLTSYKLLEIERPVHTVASRSRSRRAVMKRRAIRGRESVQHKMYMTDLDHGSTGFCRALIVLAVPAISTMPGVCAFNHPVWLQRYEATCARRTRLHFDAPASPMLSQPGVQRMVVILLIRKDLTGCKFCSPT